MNITSSLSAYFFNIEYYDDPNIEISRDEIQIRHNEAGVFISAANDLIDRLEKTEADNETDIMTIFYDIGKQYFGEDKKQLFRFFALLYMVIWGKTVGPRFGVFAILFGKNEFVALIRDRLSASINWIG